MLLSADRTSSGVAGRHAAQIPCLRGGLATSRRGALGTNFNANAQTPAWTDKMHKGQGNVLLSDGSAQQLTSARLRELLRNTGDTSAAPTSPGPNTILFPN
jgi:hypothetical protein